MNSETDANLPTVEIDELRGHIERRDGFVLDVRKNTGSEMMLGAVRYRPSDLLETEKLMLPLPKSEGFVAVYDEDGDSDRLRTIASRLLEQGYATVRVVRGGFAAWKAAGGETQETTIEQPVPLAAEHRLLR